MVRLKKDIGEKEMLPFPVALRTLMSEEPITTQEKLAEITGKTRQTVSQYIHGISEPGYDTLIKIADFFNVSTDYLLGRTDDPNRLPSVIDDLGLSLKAVETIEQLEMLDTPNGRIQFGYASEHAIDVLNCLLESSGFQEVMENLLMCFDSFCVKANGYKMKDDYCLFESNVNFTGHVVLKADDAGRFYANEAANALNKLACQEIPILVDSLMKE